LLFEIKCNVSYQKSSIIPSNNKDQ
jgi:hypothetical protein